MNLDTKSPVGNGVSKPEMASYEASRTQSVPLSNSTGLNNGYSTENRSAQFKNPQAKQEQEPAEAFNQYQ